MAQVKKRQVISAFMVLPPFEVVDYPKTFSIKMEMGGGIVSVNVPVTLFESQEEYSEEVKKQVKAMEDGDNLARADKVEIINTVSKKINLIKDKRQFTDVMDYIRNKYTSIIQSIQIQLGSK